MKVLLVAPIFRYGQTPPALLSLSDFPSGLAYIGAALREAGHEVRGLNPNNIPGYDKAYFLLTNMVATALEEFKPDLVGLGGLCTDFTFLKDAIELTRKFAPGTPIVLGGGIINNDREFIFNLLKPDFGIVGEGEETVMKLASAMQDGKDYGGIENLAYWDAGLAIFNPVHFPHAKVDDRPLPDYEPFGVRDMLDNYSMATRLLYRYGRTNPRPFPLVTARGCPFNCSFCIHRGNQLYRARSIEKVMEEIRVTYDKYRYNILIILDELFAVNKQRMRAFCEAVLEGKCRYGWDFDWMFQTHASAALDLDTLLLAKEAGCFFFSYGIESASPKVLASMNKKTKVPQIIEAIDLAAKAGIGFGGNLIFGDPAETQETIYESLDFFAKYGQSTFIFCGYLMPYPGNELFDDCLKRGIIRDKATYYANIDKGIFNMTSLPDSLWGQWVNFLGLLERSWLWVKDCDATSIEKEDGYESPVLEHYKADMYQVETICPYCGASITYREMIGQVRLDWPLFLGVGCPKCNRRIKVNLKVVPTARKVERQREAELVCL